MSKKNREKREEENKPRFKFTWPLKVLVLVVTLLILELGGRLIYKMTVDPKENMLFRAVVGIEAQFSRSCFPACPCAHPVHRIEDVPG